jgi:hypothetical protein
MVVSIRKPALSEAGWFESEIANRLNLGIISGKWIRRKFDLNLG